MFRALSVVLMVNICKTRVASTFFPSEMMLFYLVTRGWNFASGYVGLQSINYGRHIERRPVNREEFREYAPESA